MQREQLVLNCSMAMEDKTSIMMKYHVQIKCILLSPKSEQQLIQRLKDENFMSEYLYDNLSEIIKCVLMGYHPESEYIEDTTGSGVIDSTFIQSDTYGKSLEHFFKDLDPFLTKESFMNYTVETPDGKTVTIKE